MLAEWTVFPRSSWYYKPSNGQRGIQPSTHTKMRDGAKVTNQKVVEDIKKVFNSGLDFLGYEKTTWELERFRLHHQQEEGIPAYERG